MAGVGTNPLPQGNGLRATWTASANDVWAIGDGGTALHWNGDVWSLVATPTTADLQGIWGSGPSDVWAVGAETLLHWNGSTWSAMDCVGGADFSGVWGSSANDVWAVGALGGQGAIFHWDGAA